MLLGLAGIGKTQTAIEYCYRYSENYDWQFWIPAGSDEALLAAFRGVADRMPASERVSEDAVGDVIAWLETTGMGTCSPVSLFVFSVKLTTRAS